MRNRRLNSFNRSSTSATRLVREVMVPRPDVVAAPVELGIGQVLDLIVRHGYSRIPVYKGGIDEVVGVAYAKDLLRHLHAGRHDVELTSILRDPLWIPETVRATGLLKEMQKQRVHLAIVTDEYGSTAGLVTIEDLLEELVGDYADEHDQRSPEVVQLDDNRYRVSGKLSIDDLNELLDVGMPNKEWDTVAGLIYGLLGAVPTEGTVVREGHLLFTVEKLQGRRITQVLIEGDVEEPKAPAED